LYYWNHPFISTNSLDPQFKIATGRRLNHNQFETRVRLYKVVPTYTRDQRYRTQPHRSAKRDSYHREGRRSVYSTKPSRRRSSEKTRILRFYTPGHTRPNELSLAQSVKTALRVDDMNMERSLFQVLSRDRTVTLRHSPADVQILSFQS
jgi:hypothetical protein